MATIVNNPAPQSNDSGNGFLIGILILVVVVVIALYFGIPALRSAEPVQVNVPAPQINVEAPKVDVPDKIEVEVAPAQ